MVDITANISSLDVDKLKKQSTIKRNARNVQETGAKTATGENKEIFKPQDFYSSDYDAAEEKYKNDDLIYQTSEISNIGALIETGALEQEDEVNEANETEKQQKARRCISAYQGTDGLK